MMFAEIDWVALFEASSDLPVALFFITLVATLGSVACVWVVSYYVSVLVCGWPLVEREEEDDSRK